jgi:lipopolysaccharide export LptBFGC system permease protein LptF
VVFYLLTIIANILGELAIVPPVIAAWLPNVTLFAVVIELFRKAR